MIRLFMTSGEAYDFYKIIKNETKTLEQIQKNDPELKKQMTQKNRYFCRNATLKKNQ